MAWDIYGNPLRRGHCEVHPDVPDSYPCHVCLSERARDRQHESHMDRKYNKHIGMLEDEYYFGQAVEEIRRFAREDVLTKISKEASEHLLNVALGLEELSGWSYVGKEGKGK